MDEKTLSFELFYRTNTEGGPDWWMHSRSLSNLEALAATERERANVAQQPYALLLVYEELSDGAWKKSREEHLAD